MRYGENLAFFSPVGIADPARVVGGWYAEAERYDFSRPGFSFEAGHFTQVVWVGTREVGCGVARCGDRAEIWVCNYGPPGNVQGEFERNVLPAGCRR